MFNFENSIVIDRPIEKVFAFVADLPSIPKWNYYVLSVVPTSPESGTAGSTYHQVRKDDEQDLSNIETRSRTSLSSWRQFRHQSLNFAVRSRSRIRGIVHESSISGGWIWAYPSYLNPWRLIGLNQGCAKI